MNKFSFNSTLISLIFFLYSHHAARFPRRASVSGSVDVKQSQHYYLSQHNLLHGTGHLSQLNLSDSQASQLGHLTDKASSQFKIAGPTTRVCNLYLQSDTYLWDRVMRMQHVQGNRELAVKEITSIFTLHVQGAQVIYQFTVFRDHSVSGKELSCS